MDAEHPMYTFVSRKGPHAVVRPMRRLLGDEETCEFQALVCRLDAEQLRALVIDLGELDFVNSPGLSALFDAYQLFAKRGAYVSLARVRTRIEHLLVVTRLDQVFDVYPTVESALASADDRPTSAAV